MSSRAAAGAPHFPADVAKLRRAERARHVLASGRVLDQDAAGRAAAPAEGCGERVGEGEVVWCAGAAAGVLGFGGEGGGVKDVEGGGGAGAGAVVWGWGSGRRGDGKLTPGARGVSLAAAGGVSEFMNPVRCDPEAAVRSRAVDALCCRGGKLGMLLLVALEEGRRQVLGDDAVGNRVQAALRRPLHRVGDGRLDEEVEAGLAVGVADGFYYVFGLEVFEAGDAGPGGWKLAGV